MRAITIHEPYATAIVTGVKRYETRPRRTNIRGLVAIHAGLKRTSLDFSKANIYLKPEYLAYGAVVGFAEIADCVPVEEIRGNLSDVELAMGDYSPGRFAWVLKNPIMLLTIVPAKGKQGWWQWEKSCWNCAYIRRNRSSFTAGREVCANAKSVCFAHYLYRYEYRACNCYEQRRK